MNRMGSCLPANPTWKAGITTADSGRGWGAFMGGGLVKAGLAESHSARLVTGRSEPMRTTPAFLDDHKSSGLRA